MLGEMQYDNGVDSKTAALCLGACDQSVKRMQFVMIIITVCLIVICCKLYSAK